MNVHRTKSDRASSVRIQLTFGLLVLATILGLGNYLHRTFGESGRSSSDKTVAIMHWQLEHGYREALQSVIDKYNSLPHVKEAGIHVRQRPVPLQIYTEQAYIGAAAGELPDIVQLGFGIEYITSTDAELLLPLDPYLAKPNPYNDTTGIDDAIAQLPWQQTFTYNMLNGFVFTRQQHFGVPLNNYSNPRIFYNEEILIDTKAYLLNELNKKDRPDWLGSLLITRSNPNGWLKEDARLLDWLKTSDPPSSLGQFILYAKAVENTDARKTGYLIVGDFNSLIYKYSTQMSPRLDSPKVFDIYLLEWLNENWSLENPSVQSLFELLRYLSTEIFPYGWETISNTLGKDIFAQGNAAMYVGSSYELPDLRMAAPDLMLTFGRLPEPALNEKYASAINYDPARRTFGGEVYFCINKLSSNRNWAIDFLQYASSVKVNEQFNQQALWLPTVVGAKPKPELDVFLPISAKRPAAGRFLFSPTGTDPLILEYKRLISLWMNSSITYEELKVLFDQINANTLTGIPRVFDTILEEHKARYINDEQNLIGNEIKALIESSGDIGDGYLGSLQEQIEASKGYRIRALWKHYVPDQPFPEN